MLNSKLSQPVLIFSLYNADINLGKQCVYMYACFHCVGLSVIHAGAYAFVCCMCITVHTGIVCLVWFFVVYIWIMCMRLYVWYMCM